MSLISTIKSILGMSDSERAEEGTTVTVEREPGGSAGGAVGGSVERTTDEPDTDDMAGETEIDVGVSVPEDEQGEAEEAGATDERAETEGTGEPVDTISGIGPAYAERLADAGIETIDDLAAADAAEIAEETDIAESRVRDWVDRAGSS